MTFRGYVTVQSRGVVALPAEVRRRLHLDEPGAQVEITERDDGVLELRPSLPIPADQRVHPDGDALLDHLDQLDAEADASGR